jgi:hypothetical protein
MPLIHYATYIYFAGGNPAASTPCPVYLAGGNQLVPLRADKAGTVPLAQPPVTDGDGLLVFYAPPGDYTTWISGTPVLLTVDPLETDEAWPNTFVHMQTVAATTWTIDHWFGIKPQVMIDVGNSQVEAEVDHPSLTQTTLTFSSAQSGAAYLRR